MSDGFGTLVFARYDSQRLPGKALLPVGGMPLLERVIRRARLLPWPVYLATSDKPSDDALVALARDLGVDSFRGSEDRVLERAVLAAEAFGLSAFARVCGDRPLFPLDELLDAAAIMGTAADSSPSARSPDLVTNRLHGDCAPGLTTEVMRTASLRRILERGVSVAEQEHLTRSFYEHPREFTIVALPMRAKSYRSPGFAVDTAADLARLDRVFAGSGALDMSAAEADRIMTQET